MASRVADLLHRKGHDVVTVAPTETVFEAISRMVEANVGSILITSGPDDILGIFTERDYLRRIILEGRSSKTTLVEEVMTPDIIFAEPAFTLQECLATMTRKRCRHLPVLDEGRLVGVVSMGDCVKEISEDARSRVQYLERYISGEYPG